MQAYTLHAQCVVGPEDTLPPWQSSCFDAPVRESSAMLASERPTVPPPRRSSPRAWAESDVVVSRFHLGPSVDEVLYRLSVGDLTGAALANEELEGCVPTRRASDFVVAALQLSHLEEYMLASVDGASTWGDILDSAPFAPHETLRALCRLVDEDVIVLATPAVGH
jgi:hypothetical protein